MRKAENKPQTDDTQAPTAEAPARAEPAPPMQRKEREAPPPGATERKLQPMAPIRLAEADQKRRKLIGDADEGALVDDLRDPAYWAHVAQQLRPWDEVRVRAHDGTWYADCLVLEAGRNWARMHIERVEYLTTADVAITQADTLSPYEITHRGPRAMWSVIRKSDRAVQVEGLQTMQQAADWLKERLKAGV